MTILNWSRNRLFLVNVSIVCFQYLWMHKLYCMIKILVLSLSIRSHIISVYDAKKNVFSGKTHRIGKTDNKIYFTKFSCPTLVTAKINFLYPFSSNIKPRWKFHTCKQLPSGFFFWNGMSLSFKNWTLSEFFYIKTVLPEWTIGTVETSHSKKKSSTRVGCIIDISVNE